MGVYQLDMSQADPNWAAMHKEMGIPEADTKAMISGGNVHTMTVMENKDGSFTTSTNNTVVPHHNSSFTSKPGEIKKMEKPFPCTVSWDYWGENESVMNIEMAPGRYKMVTKTKTGKTGDFEMNFTEHGVFETMTVGGLSASCFYRRLGDFEGTWKVCSKVGAEGYLDACGMPEPMKSELLAAHDVVEMKRLGGGKISTKSSSKFMPGENVMKLGEQWEIEMPGFGKMTGVF